MARESKAEKQKRAKDIIKKLKSMYPDAKCSLTYSNPLELLIATILSAQCTDARVNIVTPPLFKKYRSVKDFAEADISDLETLVRSTGFYKNKAKNIKACAQKIITDHGGTLPQTMAELSQLPGVGRKTANVVLGNAFGIPGLTVDTHVTRLTNRLGLSKGVNAVKIEFQLGEVIEQKEWTHFSHLLISHGREICVARKPRCFPCGINKLCPQIGVILEKTK